MKKLLILLFLAVSIVTLSFGIIDTAQAKEENPILAKDQIYNGFYIRAGNTITVDGKVNGDVVAFGQKIIINGEVDGAVYAMGQEVVVNGKIKHNLNAAGAKIIINGEVEQTSYWAGAEIQLNNSAKLGGGLMAMGSKINIQAPVNGQLYAFGDSVTINSTIKGDTTVASSNLVVGDSAKIEGNLRYETSSDAKISNDKNITGSVTKIQPEQSKAKNWVGMFVSTIVGFLTSLILGLVFVNLLPSTSAQITSKMTKHTAFTIVCGLLTLIITPIAVILLLVTIIGLSLGLVVGLIYIALLFVAEIVTAFWLGRLIVKEQKITFAANLYALVIGLLIIKILQIIPIIGAMTVILSLIFGLGGISNYTYSRLKEKRAAQLKLASSKK